MYRLEPVVLKVVIILAVVLLTFFCFLPHHRLVQYLSDDAFYYFKVARHISQGLGPTFDGVTVTTGFHPLYTGLLAALHHAFSLSDNGMVRSALLINSISFLLTGFFISVAARRLWGETASIWAAILWFSNPNALFLVVTGMEGSLYAFLIAAFMASFIPVMAKTTGAAREWPMYASLGLWGGLCVVARTDALVLVAISSVLLFFAPMVNQSGISISRFIRQNVFAQTIITLTFLVFAILPFTSWLLYAQHYTGTYMQVSAQMKQIWRQQAVTGMDPLHELLFSAGLFSVWVVKSVMKVPALKFVAVCGGFAGTQHGTIHSPRYSCVFHLLWILPLSLGLAYSVTFPATWTWYYAPGLVTLTILAAGGISQIKRRIIGKTGSNQMSRWMTVFLVLAAFESCGYLTSKILRGRNRNQTDMYVVAQWIRENIPNEARMAAWNAGVYGWYSGHTVINLDGLINNDIAPIRKRGDTVGDYLNEKNIEYVVDVARNMKKHIPEWPEDRYEVIHWHESTNMLPIAVWKIKQP